MILYGQIDLHMHSTVSDGTDTPAEILGRAKALGLVLFSITDHDAVKGCLDMRDHLGGGDPLFLTGVEFSCRDEEGSYHILGYGYDPEAPSVRDVVDLGHSYRMKKNKVRIEYLEKECGIVFPPEEIEEFFSLDNPGKPHIGNMLVRHGYAATKDEAIRKYVNRVHFKGGHVRPEEAIEGILGGGGIPVLAHPSFGSGEQLITGEAMDRRLQKLTGFGLQGVEAFYSGFSMDLQREMLAFADEYDLLVTAGSDYHGKNKTVKMGDTGLPDLSGAPRRLLDFIDLALEKESGH